MKNAIIRLVAISLFTVFTAIFVVIGLRLMGRAQVFSQPPHPWFDRREWEVVEPPPEAVCNRSRIVGDPGDRILMVTVQRQERSWVLPCRLPISIAEAIGHSNHVNWLVKLTTGDTNGLDDLVASLAPLDDRKSLAIYAPSQNVARHLRRAAPRWLFAADSASLLRLHVFRGMFLESIMEFWPDFVISSDNRYDGSRLSAAEVDELHRRKKRVLWHDTSGSRPTAPFSVDGSVRKMIDRPR